MDPTHLQIQVSSSGSSPSNIVTNADNTFTASSQLSLQNEPLPQQESQSGVNMPEQTSSENPTLTAVHSTVFYYQPPNEFCHYYVDCKEISYDAVIYLLNKS